MGKDIEYTVTISTEEYVFTIESGIGRLGYLPHKKLFAEQGTSTYCTYCPSGHVYMDKMKEEYPESFIGVAVHCNLLGKDPMYEENYVNGFSRYVTSYPNFLMNRNKSKIIYPTELPNYMNPQGDDLLTPASLDIKSAVHDKESGKMQIHLNSKFAINLSGKIGVDFAIIVVEQDVRGTEDNYVQLNAYSGAPTEMGGYEKLPNPVPADQMVYSDVVRGIFPSYDGVNFLPDRNIKQSETVEWEYVFDLPDNIHNSDKVDLVVLMIDSYSKKVLNAAKIEAADIETGNIVAIEREDRNAGFIVDLFKNKGQLDVSVKTETPEKAFVEVYSLDGKMVYKTLPIQISGQHVFSIPSNGLSGMYIVCITGEKTAVSKKIIF